MTAVTYIAKRSIVAGHSPGNSYSINIPCVAMPITRQVNKKVQESLNYTRETIYLSSCEIWEVNTASLKFSDAMAVKEFLDSVEDGSTFTFDAYGKANTPNNPVTAEIESTGYSQIRDARGQGGANDNFRYSFMVRIVT